MQKIKGVLNRIISCLPQYAVIPLLSCLAVNMIVYYGIGVITQDWRHYDLNLPLDRAVPLVPVFVFIYLGSFLFWTINYILIMRQSEDDCYRFAFADILSRILCGIIFLLLPTTNMRPQLPEHGISVALLRMIYQIDEPSRLFPSIHCLVSWLCFIGIRKCRSISKLYKVFSCVFALLICISTQVLKQHYLVDMVGGIIIAEFAYYLAYHYRLYEYLGCIFQWAYRKTVGKNKARMRKNLTSPVVRDRMKKM